MTIELAADGIPSSGHWGFWDGKPIPICLPCKVERTESGWVATTAGPYLNTRIAPLGPHPPSGPVKGW